MDDSEKRSKRKGKTARRARVSARRAGGETATATRRTPPRKNRALLAAGVALYSLWLLALLLLAVWG